MINLEAYSMLIARLNVKRKRYQKCLEIRSLPPKSRQIVPRNPALFPLHFRRNWLNTLRPPFDLRSAGRAGPKPAGPSPEKERDRQRVGRWDQVTPGERAHMIRGLVKNDTIFSPIVAVGEDLKLLAVQRMKGMGDREYSFLKRWRRCS